MTRIPELDALRALAALAVVVYHLRPGDYRLGTTNLGEAAVNGFLVLSGYLITRIILENRDRPGFLGRFYLRRGLRTWPIYYLALLALLAANPHLPEPYSLKNVWPYFVYLQNTALGWPRRVGFNPAFDHTWSLYIEEQFYLVWPLAVGRGGKRALVALAAGCVAFAVWARAEGWHPWLLGSRVDGFACGALIAVAVGSAVRRRTIGVGFAGLALVATIAWQAAAGRSFALDLLLINAGLAGLTGLAIVGAGYPLLAPLRWRPLVYLGTISYGIYLYHYIVYWAFGGFAVRFDQPWPVDVDAAKVLASLAIASWELIERPVPRLKDRIAYGRPARRPATAVFRAF